jgi:hypothetical protein
LEGVLFEFEGLERLPPEAEALQPEAGALKALARVRGAGGALSESGSVEGLLPESAM